MTTTTHPPTYHASSTAEAALHEAELGIERLHRAHGHLVAFHHNIGRGMNHLAAAEPLLRDAGHDDLADELRDDYLPRGVIPHPGSPDPSDGRWSWYVLERFQTTFYHPLVGFGDDLHDHLGDGAWHANERNQEQAWKTRARTHPTAE